MPPDSSNDSGKTTVASSGSLEGANVPGGSSVWTDPAMPAAPKGGWVKRQSLFVANGKALTLTMVAVGASLVVGLGGLLVSNLKATPDSQNNSAPSYTASTLKVSDLVGTPDLQLARAESLSINGQLQLAKGLVLSPQAAPTSPVAGQIYFNSADKKVYFYNGVQFTSLAVDGAQKEELIKEAGLGVALSNGTLNNSGVLSLQGQAGDVQLLAGNGISMDGLRVANTGVLSIDGTAGQIVASGSRGSIKLSLPQSIDAAAAPKFANLTLTNLASGSLLVGGGNGALSGLTAAAAGLCLVSTGVDTAPQFGSCSGSAAVTGVNGLQGNITLAAGSGVSVTSDGVNTLTVSMSGGSGVTSINGVSGVANIANATTSGSDIILNDATTSSKGIASFTAGDFSVSGGSVALNASVTRLGNGVNIAGGLVQLTAGGLLPALNGSLLTNLNAAAISLGTIDDARLSGNIARLDQAANFSGASLQFKGQDVCTLAGNCVGLGGGITGAGTTGVLSMFTSAGTIGDSILSQTGTTLTAAGTIAATNLQGNGSAVTGLNASNLTSGTVASARITGAYSGITAVGTLTGLAVSGNGSFTGTVSGAGAVNGNEFITKNQLDTAIGGVDGGVASLNSQTGTVSLQGTANRITVSTTAGIITLNTPQDINATANVTFASLAVGNVTSVGRGSFTGTVSGANAVNNNEFVTKEQLDSAVGSVGGGSALGGSGTAGAIAVFTGSGTLSSSVLTQNGTRLIAAGTVSGANAVDSSDFVTLAQLSSAIGGVSGGVTALNSLTGDLTVQGTNNQIYVTTDGGVVTLSTPQDINTTSSVVFAGLNVTGSVQSGGVVRLDAVGNLSNIGNITASGTLSVNGSGNFTGRVAGADAVAVNEFITKNQLDSAIGSVGNGIKGTGTAGTLAVFSDTGTIADSILTQTGATLTAAGTLVATNLQGNGSAITNLNASNISSGTVAGARLSGSYTGITAVGTLTSLAVSGNGSFTGTVSGADAINGNEFITKNQLTTAVLGLGYVTLQASPTGAADIGHFNITGTGIAGKLQGTDSVLTPSLDAVVAGALNIGSTNATSINLNQNVIIAAQKTITMVGGTTAQRPVSPTEGMLYFDATTKQLLTYANGKWQGDRNVSTKIVAASNASQSLKDSADYVVSGNADDEINAALAAAAGGKVYLTEGTYVAGAAILIPNNTTLAGSGRSTVIEMAGINTNTNMIQATGSNRTGITIQDLRLDGRKDLNTAGTQVGIYLQSVGAAGGASPRTGAKVVNVEVGNFNSDGLYVLSSEDSSFSNVISRNNGANGINVISNSNNIVFSEVRTDLNGANGLNVQGEVVTVQNSSARGNAGSGYAVSGNASSTKLINLRSEANALRGVSDGGTYTILENSTMVSNVGDGVYLGSGSENAIIKGNIVSSNSRGVVGDAAGGAYLTISDNIVTGSVGHGIEVYRPYRDGRVMITNNRVYNSGGYGIVTQGYLYQVVYQTINDNFLQGNASGGIWASSMMDSVIANNRIVDNGGTTANNGIVISSSYSTNNSITGNSITDTSCTSTCYAITIAGKSNYLSNNSIGNGMDNLLSDTTYGKGAINDSGSGTVYANQRDADGNLINKSTGAFTINTSTVTSSMSLQGGLTSVRLPSPGTPTIARTGASGSTTYSYVVTALDGTGETLPSPARTINNAYAVLDSTNYNTIEWSSVPGAVSYKIYRTASGGAPSSTGLIATAANTDIGPNRLKDTGLAATAGVPTANTTGGGSFAGSLQGGSSLTLGSSGSMAGSLILRNSANANVITVTTGTQTGNFTATIPTLNSDDIFCMRILGNCTPPESGNFIKSGVMPQQANFNIQSGDGANVVGALRGAAGQSADMLQIQGADGSALAGFDSLGQMFMMSGGFRGTIRLASLTNDTIYVLPATTMNIVEICTSAGNCIPNGNNAGDMLYWNGTKWAVMPAPTAGGSTLRYCGGTMTWGDCAPIVVTHQTVTFAGEAMPQVTGTVLLTSEDDPVIATRGLVYGTSPNPTLASGTAVPSGGGQGTFTATFGPLSIGTYYVRAYATNAQGTTYGNNVMINIDTLAVGARGPAGGWIIYDKGSYSDGWRYLEAAPTDAGLTTYMWGCYGNSTGTGGANAVGLGASNTQRILANCFEGSFAAKAAVNYGYNGYNDWFLPSINEMDLVTKLKTIYGVGNLVGDYWSSSEYSGPNSSTHACRISSTGGQACTTSKNTAYSVRAIRAF